VLAGGLVSPAVVRAQDGGDDGFVPTPRNNVSGGAVAGRAPGLWVRGAIGYFAERHNAMLNPPISAGIDPGPGPADQVVAAFLDAFYNLIRDLVTAFFSSLVPDWVPIPDPDPEPEPAADQDDDGVADDADNCPLVITADQADADGDGVGDACDVCPGFDDADDRDGDGVPDSCDNCPALSNPGQANTDQDSVGDACDNCPYLFNPNQRDLNEDGVGDLCENDADGDAWNNDQDNCPTVANFDQADTDGDGIGDACDLD